MTEPKPLTKEDICSACQYNTYGCVHLIELESALQGLLDDLPDNSIEKEKARYWLGAVM